jgi:hypothetical protein
VVFRCGFGSEYLGACGASASHVEQVSGSCWWWLSWSEASPARLYVFGESACHSVSSCAQASKQRSEGRILACVTIYVHARNNHHPSLAIDHYPTISLSAQVPFPPIVPMYRAYGDACSIMLTCRHHQRNVRTTRTLCLRGFSLDRVQDHLHSNLQFRLRHR